MLSIDTIHGFLLGTSIPTAALPGIGASILISEAARLSLISSDRLVILNDGKIVVDGAFPYVFSEERVMRKIGLEVPFAIELSQKLMVFGLIDDLELNLERLVSKLWK